MSKKIICPIITMLRLLNIDGFTISITAVAPQKSLSFRMSERAWGSVMLWMHQLLGNQKLSFNCSKECPHHSPILALIPKTLRTSRSCALLNDMVVDSKRYGCHALVFIPQQLQGQFYLQCKCPSGFLSHRISVLKSSTNSKSLIMILHAQISSIFHEVVTSQHTF